MKVKSKNLIFSELPSIKQLKGIIAEQGATAGPGPVPRSRNFVKSLPDNYFDMFGGPQRAQLPGIAPIDKGPINTSNAIPIQGEQPSNPGYYPKPQTQQRQPNVGNAVLAGLEMIDFAIPGEKIHNQQVVQPYETGYHPHPLGTGSQALMDDGGWMMDPRRETPIVIAEGTMDNMPSANLGAGIPIGKTLQYENMEEAKSGNWIKGAVNPKHKGYCTPMTKSTCTPRRKAFAKTMKKHHGFHKNGGIIPDNMSNFTQYEHGGTARGGSDTMNIFEQIVMHPNMADMQGYANGGSVNFMENIMFHPNQRDIMGWAEYGRKIPAGPNVEQPPKKTATKQGPRYIPNPPTYNMFPTKGPANGVPSAADSADYLAHYNLMRNDPKKAMYDYEYLNSVANKYASRDPYYHPENFEDIDKWNPSRENALNAYEDALEPGTMILDLPPDTKKPTKKPLKKKAEDGNIQGPGPRTKPRYNFSVLMDHTPNSLDSANYRVSYNALLNKEPWAMKLMQRYQDYGVPMGTGTTDKSIYAQDMTQMQAFEDAQNPVYLLDLPPDTKKPPSKPTKKHKYGGSVRGGSDTMNIFEQIVMHPNMEDMSEWDKAAKGKTLTRSKAREILHDKTAHGYPLTEKQRRFFGAVASGYAAEGLPIPGGGGGGIEPGKGFTAKNLIGAQTSGIKDAQFVDTLNYVLASGNQPKGGVVNYDADQKELIKSAYLWKKQNIGRNPEEVIQGYYNRPTTEGNSADYLRQRLSKIGYDPVSMYHTSPNVDLQLRQGMQPNTMASGGVMYADGGEIETMWGGNVNQMSDNPYDGGTMQFNGASHDQGGIGMHYNGNPVEVEGGETAAKDSQGNLNIFGNMYLPGSKTKFKTVSKEIGKKEKRYDFLKTRGSELVNNSNPGNKFEQLSFNAGKAMMSGGMVGQRDLAEKKENLANLQRAMLDTADQFGLDAQYMSGGKIKKAKGGASIPFMEDGGNPSGDPNDPSRADRNKNPGNIRWGKFAREIGAIGKDRDGFAIFPSREIGESAMVALLKSDKYRNMSVKDAIRKWTGGKPYKYDLGEINNMKIDDLDMPKLDKVLATMTKGEGTRYGYKGPKKPTGPQGPPAVPKRYGPPDVPLTPVGPRPVPDKTVPPPLDNINVPRRPQLPTNAEPLHLNEVMGEIYAAATNKVDPVAMQKYNPQLYQPYQVSFQDRINQNQETYNALQRTLGATNPSALSAIAAQKYAADTGVKADEFRTNQGISDDITNKNIALTNDAQLKNLALADQQYVRQSTAKSKTAQLNQMIINSISGKYAQNQLENKRLTAYENLYDYRFTPTDQGGQQATYFGPNAVFNYNQNSAAQRNATDLRTVSRYDRNGNLKGYTSYDESSIKDARDMIELENQRRKLPLLTAPPLQ